MVYRKSNVEILKGYADTESGADTTSRKFTSGYCFYVFGNVISWNTKKQNIVATSTTEDKIIALSHCISEACWLRNLMLELKLLESSF